MYPKAEFLPTVETKQTLVLLGHNVASVFKRSPFHRSRHSSWSVYASVMFHSASLGVRCGYSAGGWTMRRVDAVHWVWMTISHTSHDWFVLIICVANLATLQARGPRKHLKRLAAPSSWMLDKLSGTYVRSLPSSCFLLVLTCFQAPRPSPGPHRLRESLPLSIFLRNRLKYALTGREVTLIVQQRLIKVDGKVRTDNTYPAGFMGTIFNDKPTLYGLIPR